MKIALAQVNTTAGDIEGNLLKVKENIARAASAGADLVVFPQYTLGGFVGGQLLRERDFVERSNAALREVAAAAKGVAVLVGHVGWDEPGNPTSAASVFVDGECAGVFGRPTVAPWEEPPGQLKLVELKGTPIGVVLHVPPRADFSSASLGGARLLVGLCALPVCEGRPEEHRRTWGDAARSLGVSVAVANLVGGNDMNVFDGSSFVLDARGRLLALAASFREDLLTVDLDSARPIGADQGASDNTASLYEALKLGLADYVRKSGFADVVLGLSGGLDSSVVAAVSADALGPDHVVALGMPSVYSSQASRESAQSVAENLGITYHVISIEEAREAFERTLASLFEGTEPDTTEENIQARIRAVLLMAYANKFGAMPLACGNRSELAMGYCTLYGDTAGGLAVIGDVPKTVVYELAAHINRDREVIPRSVIERAPSAELKPDQTDQDDLPPYEVLDGILARYLDRGMDPAEIAGEGFDRWTVEDVIARVKWAAFKRQQAPPALRVYSLGWPQFALTGQPLPPGQKSADHETED